MKYVNPPESSPQHVFHKTYYSHILKNEIGYNIFLPLDYHTSKDRYPVTYHIHGWTGNESTDIWTMEKVYKNKEAITVFIHAVSGKEVYYEALLEIEFMFIHELIPHIDDQYRTQRGRESRMISGFSMGGNMAFYFAIKHWNLFSAVTAYAGTYHHLYNKAYRTVGVALDKVKEMFSEVMSEKWYLEETNILHLVRQHADIIRENLQITMHIGTDDILFCDNEIMHLFLNEMNIPHNYITFTKASHSLEEIL